MQLIYLVAQFALVALAQDSTSSSSTTSRPFSPGATETYTLGGETYTFTYPDNTYTDSTTSYTRRPTRTLRSTSSRSRTSTIPSNAYTSLGASSAEFRLQDFPSFSTYEASVLNADSVSTTYAVTCLPTGRPDPLYQCPPTEFTVTVSNYNYNYSTTATLSGGVVQQTIEMSLSGSALVEAYTYTGDGSASVIPTISAMAEDYFDVREATITITAGFDKLAAASTVAPSVAGVTGASNGSSAANGTAANATNSQGAAARTAGGFTDGTGLWTTLLFAASSVAALAFML